MNKIYIRVSTDKQEQDRQKYILKENGFTEDNSVFYEEVYSGKTKNRPVLIKLLNELEQGDVLVVTDLSRLARSVKDLWEINEELTKKKATLNSLKEKLDLGTSTGRLLFTMIGGIYQFERDVLSDRTKEALAAKRENGVVLGRPKVITDELINSAVEMYMQGGHSYNEVGENFGISGVSVFNEVKKRGLNRKRTRNVKKEK